MKPSIYKNPNINPINHNKNKTIIKETNTNVEEELNKIFNGFSYPYNTKVILKTINKEIETYLVKRTKDSIITLDNEIIPIKEIINLSIKKKDF